MSVPTTRTLSPLDISQVLKVGKKPLKILKILSGRLDGYGITLKVQPALQGKCEFLPLRVQEYTAVPYHVGWRYSTFRGVHGRIPRGGHATAPSSRLKKIVLETRDEKHVVVGRRLGP